MVYHNKETRLKKKRLIRNIQNELEPLLSQKKKSQHLCHSTKWPRTTFSVIVFLHSQVHLTPLHYNLKHGFMQNVRIILDKHPDLDDTYQGTTVLHAAIHTRDEALIKRVFACHQSQLSVQDERERTPLQLALMLNISEDVIDLFDPEISAFYRDCYWFMFRVGVFFKVFQVFVFVNNKNKCLSFIKQHLKFCQKNQHK